MNLHASQLVVERQKAFFATHQTLDYDFRIAALRKLLAAVQKHEKQITDALWKDLCKSEFESYATEIGFVISEINYAIRNLKRWMRAERHKTPLMLFGSHSELHHQPYGVVLIIAPWNYPFQLQLSPLVSAIAAGNCAVLKPSATSANVRKVLEQIIFSVFDPEYIAVVELEHQDMDHFIEQRFDYIFFTGGVNFGRHIMQMAARTLTPVTLELGGKSPCIVDRDADIKIAARRIVWGKFLNAGQTCVAPDYVMVHKDVENAFLWALQNEITRQYGCNPHESPDYPRIITQSHCQRLAELLKCGKIVCGGTVNVDQKYIAPTVMTDIDMESPLMKEEIFGPLLPVIRLANIYEAIDYINSNEKPLALYYFTTDKKRAAQLLRDTMSGGACINDVVIHVANHHLPFGGVGSSGIGNYHGFFGFRTFSHARAVVYTSLRINLNVKFAPYLSKLKFIKRFF